MSNNIRTVLITGASSGISLEDGLARIMVIFLDRESNEIATHSLPEVIDNNDWVQRHKWIKLPNRFVNEPLNFRPPTKKLLQQNHI